MSLKRDYKSRSRAVSGRSGPGGINCPCCNAYNRAPRKMKANTRRALRRANKQELSHDDDQE